MSVTRPGRAGPVGAAGAGPRAGSYDPARLKAALVAQARRLGFVAVGVAAAIPQTDLEWLLRRRLAQGMATPWEEPDPARRTDPASLLPGARSVVAVAMGYDPPRPPRANRRSPSCRSGPEEVGEPGPDRPARDPALGPGGGTGRGTGGGTGGDPAGPRVDHPGVRQRAPSGREPAAGAGGSGVGNGGPGEGRPREACEGGAGGAGDGGALRGYVAAAGRTRSYQHVMGRRLEALGRWLEAVVPGGCRWAVQVDTGPLVDRAWAERAGIGWIGKNACLIVPGRGSWVFLGELVTDLDLPPDQPLADACADCDRCLRACPAGAFIAPRQVDPRRCISLLSQKPGMLDTEERAALGQSLYGCDVCQVVCPFNREAGPGHPALRVEARGDGAEAGAAPPLVSLLGMGRAEFRVRYRALTGAWRGRKAWQRNAVIALGNRGASARPAVPALAGVLCQDPRPDLRALAAWALGQIGGDEAREALVRARDRDRDPAVRQAAAEALATLDADAPGRRRRSGRGERGGRGARAGCDRALRVEAQDVTASVPKD